MRQDPTPGDRPAVLAAGGSTLTPPDTSVALPDMSLRVGRRMPRMGRMAPLRSVPWTTGPRAGGWAIGVVLVATLAIVAAATGGASMLVPRSSQLFPGWESGPLHLLVRHVISNPRTLGYIFTGVLLLMLGAYGVVVSAARSISARTIAIAVVAVHLILLLSPPMQLTDVFNYLGYARLGALHDLNPYTHVIRQEMFDPVYGFSSWHNLRSPYGPLFTALTYPLAFVSLPIAYWAIKISTVALSLAFVGLVAQCARQLGRDPRLPVVFVALNPIFLVYELGAFHNDFFMLVPAMGAISLLLARRDRSAGAVLMLGVAVKFTIVLILPFLIVGAVTRRRRLRVIEGVAVGGVALVAMSLVLFGFTIPNLQQQSAVLTGTSIANVVGLILHLGGATPLLLKVLEAGVVFVVAHQFFRNRDWLSGAGWATVALLVSLGWLMPWYVVWLLPLAGLVADRRLRIVAVAFTVYLVLAFSPWANYWMSDHGINLLSTHAGGAATSLQNKLAG
jgi:hypothetical protein